MNEQYNQVHEHKVPTGHQGRDSPALTGALRRRKKIYMYVCMCVYVCMCMYVYVCMYMVRLCAY